MRYALRGSRKLIIVAGLLLVTNASAQDSGPSSGPSDPAELEAWADGAINTLLTELHTAGATVSVVKDGELLFAKGYGYYDVDAGKKVNPDTTLFRIGSVSKLFVWTAVMQLVEQGKLDLNADVNTYLQGFQIPEKYDAPITLANIMTHSAGFEDWVIGLFARSADALRPLGDILADEIPRRVRPPDVASSYSNHATGMAMYIVECVSGEPWEEYLQNHIIGPLGMEHMTFAQPPPEHLADDYSKGYNWSNGTFKEGDFEFIPLASVGAAGASATDMARFMIAHLQWGQYGDVRILEEDTAGLMHSELFRHHPAVNPMAHGFFVMDKNGQHVIGHGGNTVLFHTILALFPEHNLGVFFSNNTSNGGAGATKFLDAFLNHYFPVPDAEPLEPPVNMAIQAKRYTGSYRVTRHSYSTVAKLAVFEPLRVTADEDGALHLSSELDVRWIATGPHTFRQENGHNVIAFRANGDQEITHLFQKDMPYFAYKKNGFFGNPDLHTAILQLSLVVFLLNSLFFPLNAFYRWRYQALVSPHEHLPGLARWVRWLYSVTFLVCIAELYGRLTNTTTFLFGAMSGLQPLFVALHVAGGLVAVSFIYAAIIWKRESGRVWGRILYTASSLVGLTFIWFLDYWNFLWFRY